MNARIATIAVGMTLVLGGIMAGCGQSETLEERVDNRMASISQTEKDDLCESYGVFGSEFIEILVDGLAAEENISPEEADLVFKRIVEMCDPK